MSVLELSQNARNAPTPDEFIAAIQASDSLLDALYEWENSTPKNATRFRNTGWFGIAATFWEEQ